MLEQLSAFVQSSYLAIGLSIVLLLTTSSYVFKKLSGSSPISKIPGPPSSSFLFGHLRELLKGQVGEFQFKWKEQYGNVIRYKGILGEDCLIISDPRAIHHISNHPDEFTKHPVLKEISRMLFGRGLVWADGDDHRRQRRINAPAFGANQIRAFIPYFHESASAIIDKWNTSVESSRDGTAVIDVTRMISLGALDAIGKSAFDYEFNAVADGEKTEGGNELARCFRNYAHDVFGKITDGAIFIQEMLGWIPVRLAGIFYDYAPVPALRRIRYVTNLGHEVAHDMIQVKGDELLQGKQKKDILSLLVQANAAPDDSKLKISHIELMATLHTLIIAGHETTATWLNWIMYELARNPDVQERLRKEVNERMYILRNRGDSTFSATDLEQDMSLLQAILKETLRFHGPIYQHMKYPTVDSIVPLSTPITTTDGQVLKSLTIPKGTHLYLDIAGYNRDPEIFGKDAHTWRPERFLNGEVNETSGLAGPYASVMTFSAGPRTCIGWRFAVLEAAVFAAEFVRHFEFKLTPAAKKIKREASLAMIPVLEGEEDKGHQLPLIVSLASRDD
ncbi:cytochrome P450 [Gymnopilus junonius]|uniref:Cytochrome P450 n=1 Tax=Gymnopilus junonius TaxID=109634 RepID=A0A9P5NPT4_GYMJU|nr:cytochrome P450 [Gymnopilus junonius]